MDTQTLLRAGVRSAAGRRAMARAAVDRAADQCEAFSACWDDITFMQSTLFEKVSTISRMMVTLGKY
ncbi:hypothetical protein EJB05_09665, partial [Eragrostis curvula]